MAGNEGQTPAFSLCLPSHACACPPAASPHYPLPSALLPSDPYPSIAAPHASCPSCLSVSAHPTKPVPDPCCQTPQRMFPILLTFGTALEKTAAAAPAQSGQGERVAAALG